MLSTGLEHSSGKYGDRLGLAGTFAGFRYCLSGVSPGSACLKYCRMAVCDCSVFGKLGDRAAETVSDEQEP